MAKWKQMKMIVGSIMVGALLMPTMSITAWANAETEVTVDNFESEILPNLAIKEDGTPLKVAITVAELDSEYVIAVQKYAQYLLETAGAEVTVSSADGDVENQCNQIYDLEEYAEYHPMILSGGQRQRLAICQAVMSGKKLLIFDEPTSGLDFRHMCQVEKLMKQLSEEKYIIIVVTHDYEFLNRACKRYIRINS